MNHFLQNLIDRHHEENASTGASRLVQPRPTSRYEGRADPGFSSSHANLEYGFGDQAAMRSGLDSESLIESTEQYGHGDRPVISSESRQRSQHTDVSMQSGIVKTTIQPDQSDLSYSGKDLFEHSEAETRQPEPESTSQQITKETVQHGKNRQADNSVQFDNRNLSLSDVNSRIQSTLDRLNSLQQQQSVDQGMDELHSDGTNGIDSDSSAREINDHGQAEQNRADNQQRIDTKVQRKNTLQPEAKNVANQNSATGGVNDRIQTILNRLNEQQPQHTDAQNSTEPQGEFSASTAGGNSIFDRESGARIQTNLQHLTNTPSRREESSRVITHVLHESVAEETDHVKPIRPMASSFGTEQNAEGQFSEGRLTQQVTDSIPERRVQENNGLMQVPDWLTEIQASLNDRPQHLLQIGTQEQPEPVVNVTIGRVEIKAIQAESGRKSKVSNKPIGVMDLDEYLKLRENRGRA